MAVYVISGTLVAFSGVVLVEPEPAASCCGRSSGCSTSPSEAGLAARLAVAYPLAKRFRTGATLVMYTLITLVLVLLAEISGMINASVDANVDERHGRLLAAARPQPGHVAGGAGRPA